MREEKRVILDLVAAGETVVKKASLEIKELQEIQYVTAHNWMCAITEGKVCVYIYISYDFFAYNRVNQGLWVNLAQEDQEERLGVT